MTLYWSVTLGFTQNALNMSLQCCSVLFFRSILMCARVSVKKGKSCYLIEIDACLKWKYA